MHINIRILSLLKDGRIVSPFCPYFLQTEHYKVCTFHERAHFQDSDNLRGLFSAEELLQALKIVNELEEKGRHSVSGS